MEIWKDVKGYEGQYQISNLGRVKSLGRYVGNMRGTKNFNKEFVLKLKFMKCGYVKIGLTKNNSQKFLAVHRLVALAFLPNPENKPEVNHKNGVKSDNRLCNLEWSTKSENAVHAFKMGLRKASRGELSSSSKLTEKQARKIKYEHEGLRQWEIAEIYGINRVTVCDIRLGRKWNHI